MIWLHDRTRFLCLIVVALALSLCSDAQGRAEFGRSAVTLSPLALIGVDYTIQAGFEHRLSRNVVGVQELGYIFGSGYIASWRNNVRYVTGFLFRPSVKLIINERRSSYIQPQIFYKQVTHHMHDWLEHNIVNGVPTYEKLENFKYRRDVYGFNFVLGRIVPLGRGNRLNLETYIGLGIRVKSEKVVGHKNVNYDRGGRIALIGDDGRSVLPQLPAGLRLFYYIN